MTDGMNSDDDNCSKFGKMISCASRRVPMLFKVNFPCLNDLQSKRFEGFEIN